MLREKKQTIYYVCWMIFCVAFTIFDALTWIVLGSIVGGVCMFLMIIMTIVYLCLVIHHYRKWVKAKSPVQIPAIFHITSDGNGDWAIQGFSDVKVAGATSIIDREYNASIYGIEHLLLALVREGVDVQSPMFSKALRDAVSTIANHT